MNRLRSYYEYIRLAIINAAYPQVSEGRILRKTEKFLVKQRLDDLAYHSEIEATSTDHLGSYEIVVSMTTHGKRIMTVHRAIESIIQQSVRPNRLVLYIGDKEYQDISQLPLVLQRQVARGLEIRFVKDQGPYTKLLPALRDFPDSAIITFDDDNYYPVNAIERLLSAHHRHPESICSLATRVLEWQTTGVLKPYNICGFSQNPEDSSSSMYVAEGCGGVLYPPHSLPDIVFDNTVFEKLTPHADDFWFKAMSLLKGTPVLSVGSYFSPDYERYDDEDVQDVGLSQMNICQDKNDQQLHAVLEHYGLYKKL